jgi:pyruvate dehydrogenase E2 component (dihydrolipoamide acetyltransferase)
VATNILMPALSPTMEEGKLARWLVKEGDTVKSGDILAEIETDKATMEFEAVDEGRIGKILVPEGSEGVKVNAPIAVLLGEGEKAGAVDIPAAMKDISAAVKAEAPKPAQPAPKAEAPKAEAPKPEAPKAAAPAPSQSGNRVFASPLARRIAASKGIDIASLAGTGPRGRIVKADVENAKPSLRPWLPQARLPQPAVWASRRCPMPSCSTSPRITKRSRTIRCARPSPSVSPRPRH